MLKYCTIVTCHNRASSLKNCLERLLKYGPVDNHLVLIADCVKDNSREVAKEVWGDKNITIVETPYPHFWSKGMRLGEEVSKQKNPEYIIWLNEDTYLDQEIKDIENKEDIVVGSINDENGKLFRGGVVINGGTNFTTSSRNEADTFHGNLVIIPSKIYEKLSIQNFEHAMADFYYGLEAKKLGYKIKVLPPVAWTKNDNKFWYNEKTIAERSKYCLSPKGLPPKDWWRLTRLCSSNPLHHLFLFFKPYLKIITGKLSSKGY
jgi:GT2 family glycosyltransferase